MGLRRSADGKKGVEIFYRDGILSVAGCQVPFEFSLEEGICDWHIFLDRGIVEVIADGGRISASRGISPGPEDLGVTVFARGGNASMKGLDIWTMKSIWPSGADDGRGMQ